MFGRSMSAIALGGLLIIGVALVGVYLMVLFPTRVIKLYELVVRRIAPKFEEARSRCARRR